MKLAALVVVLGVCAAASAARAERLCPTPKAVLDAATLPDDPEAQADTLFEKAVSFMSSKDYVAAAVVFEQAEGIYARLAVGADGAVVDTHARRCGYASMSNSATAYASANMPVEAVAAFTRVRDGYASEIPADELPRIERAIENESGQIGTLSLQVPEGAELSLDGRALDPAALAAPLRLAAGTHTLEATARFYKAYLHDVTVVGLQESQLTVELEPLETPGAVRFESNVRSVSVEVEGKPAGGAPLELSLAPGLHRWAMRASGYREHTGELLVRPGERTVLHADLVPRRAAMGVRIDPYMNWVTYMRDDTPFGVISLGGGLRVFHHYLRFRSTWVGFSFEWNVRALNEVGIGIVAQWCPDSMRWRHDRLFWCPVLAAAHGMVPNSGYEGQFRSGFADGKLGSSIEVRAGKFAFVRVTPNLQIVAYNNRFSGLWLGATGLEIALGLEL